MALYDLWKKDREQLQGNDVVDIRKAPFELQLITSTSTFVEA